MSSVVVSNQWECGFANTNRSSLLTAVTTEGVCQWEWCVYWQTLHRLSSIFLRLIAHTYNLVLVFMQAEEFIQTMEGSSSFYGLQDETLNSLLLTFLPSVKCNYVSKTISSRTGTESEDTQVSLLKFLLEELKQNANFSIPEVNNLLG